MNIVYVIGLPGAGKTTAVQAALAMFHVEPDEHATPIPHVRYGNVWHLGRHRENGFGGTDSLAMNINPKAVDFVLKLGMIANQGHFTPTTLIGEGDRLANNRFFAACHDAARATGGRFTLIWLDCPPVEARARASIRARALGTQEQDHSWWTGRLTRTRNILATRPATRIDATAAMGNIAAAIHHHLTKEQPA